MRDAEPLHELLDARLCLLRLAVERARQQHILPHRQAGEHHERLRREADLPIAQPGKLRLFQSVDIRII